MIVDFNNSYENNFYDNIMEELKNLDISVLINNVGILQMKELVNISEEELKSLVKINIVS